MKYVLIFAILCNIFAMYYITGVDWVIIINIFVLIYALFYNRR